MSALAMISRGAGKVANVITTVHLSYVRGKTGHALIGTRQ